MLQSRTHEQVVAGFNIWIQDVAAMGDAANNASVHTLVRIGCLGCLMRENYRDTNARRALHVDVPRLRASCDIPLPEALVIISSLTESDMRIQNACTHLTSVFRQIRASFPDLWEVIGHEVRAEMISVMVRNNPSRRPISPRDRQDSRLVSSNDVSA